MVQDRACRRRHLRNRCRRGCHFSRWRRLAWRQGQQCRLVVGRTNSNAKKVWSARGQKPPVPRPTATTVKVGGVPSPGGPPSTACARCLETPRWVGSPSPYEYKKGLTADSSLSKTLAKSVDSWKRGHPTVENACGCCEMRFWKRLDCVLHEVAGREFKESSALSIPGRLLSRDRVFGVGHMAGPS